MTKAIEVTKSDRSDRNPVGQDGANQYKQSDINEVHITLFASVPDQKQYCLIAQSLERGVLDSRRSQENFG